METVKLGSIYLDGVIQTPGFDCDGSVEISFGDTMPGQEISWVRLKSGLLIADCCVCTNISWEQLDKKSFVLGAPITIDSKTYLCRCLKVGEKEDKPNEWDAALDEAGEYNDLWHWSGTDFWGQEISSYNASSRAVRGWVSARFWDSYYATDRYVYVGFRPALEPLGSVSCSPDALIGKNARIYGPRGITLEGRLLDVDDYDFTLAPIAGTPTNCSWASRAGDYLVVSRDSILWAKEA